MPIPPVGPDGIRRTVNYGLSTAQATWNLRSALNVAALNCLDMEHADILPAYKSLLERHEKKLDKVNDTLLKEYRENFGSEGQQAFDRYMTQVYNYFALPPVMDDFCDASQKVARDSLLVESSDLEGFALRNLPVIEAAFETFFSAFENYRTALAVWDAEYGPPQPAGWPGGGDGITSIAAAASVLPDGDDTVQAIPTFDPSPSAVAETVPAGTLTLPTFELAPQGQAIPFPASEPQPVQMVSQPVVQGGEAPEPGFGPVLDAVADNEAQPSMPVPAQSSDVPTIVLTPQSDLQGADENENGGE